MALTQEAGRDLPVCITLPGCGKQVPTHRLVAHTGTRVFNKWFAQSYQPQLPAGGIAEAAAPAVPATQAQSARTVRSCRATGKHSAICQSEAQPAALASHAHLDAAAASSTPAHSADGVSDDGSDDPIDAAEVNVTGAELLAGVMCGQAPAQLTLAALCTMVDTALYFNAVELCKHLPKYIEPALSEIPIVQVRLTVRITLTVHLSHAEVRPAFESTEGGFKRSTQCDAHQQVASNDIARSAVHIAWQCLSTSACKSTSVCKASKAPTFRFF